MDLDFAFGVSDDVVEDWLQEAYGLHEAIALDGHDHVDGIEIAFASKTSGEVGVGVNGGVEVMTQRTHEAESTVMSFVDDIEDIGDQRDDLDTVA